jgi:3-oxoacyl-[acyl-carrier protein] reductase
MSPIRLRLARLPALDLMARASDRMTADDHPRRRSLKAVAPSMQAERWGRVVNISSISALGGADRVNYVSAKAGLEGLTKAAALELAPDGITVNAIGPGVVRTAMTEVSAARAGRSVDEHLDVLKRTIPVGRVGTPHDIARAVAFFTDDDAGYITGQVLYVSGAPHG